MNSLRRAAALVSALGLSGAMLAFSPVQPEKKSPPPGQPTDKKPDDHKRDGHKHDAKAEEILTGKVKRIDGTEEDLSKYKGKVVVILNVASKCGYTVQYAELETLYNQHKDKGLVVLGFPANDFGSQEPGSNSEIAQFCKNTYDVTFPLFEKISVKGKEQHELYRKLTSLPEPLGGDPKWNFTKFVLDKEGKVVARFDAKGDKTPDGKTDRAQLEPGLIKKVNELLGIKEEKKETPKPAGS